MRHGDVGPTERMCAAVDRLPSIKGQRTIAYGSAVFRSNIVGYEYSTFRLLRKVRFVDILEDVVAHAI